MRPGSSNRHNRPMLKNAACFSIAFLVGFISQPTFAADPIRVVFLGDQGHHRPADFAGRITPILKGRGIDIAYTEDVGVLSTERLKSYDALLLYANIDSISPDQETALLKFVAEGKGFVPVHCATYCFRNSDAFIELCGAQFKSHGGEVFQTVIVQPEHPIMAGYKSFQSWDETYVHHKHNTKDRTVLEVRRQGKQAVGNSEEPWTWVRTHGKGRVFYTAWGHDIRTWTQPGFHELLERGIRWATGDDNSQAGTPRLQATGDAEFPTPKMTEFRKDVKPFEYIEVGAKIPNYLPGKKRDMGAAITKMQAPLPAEESIKHYITPESFKLSLFASEPQLAGKPISMNWDERGRIWVCETLDYPNELQPIGQGRDRIRICEDTDHDGMADKFTVFADKLSIPTAIEFYRGGAIIQNGTQTIYLKDLDGDDRADLKQVLITGWALGDTHGGVSNFHYGHDNWFWAMQGYNDSKPVINGQAQPNFRMGFWRFRVEAGPSDETAPVSLIEGSRADASTFNDHSIRVRELEFIRATNNNTWGLGLSEEGLVFGSTANGNPSDFMPIANRYYERVKGWAPTTLKMISDTYMFAAATDKVRQVDWHGGYTAAAGHALYTARRYPQAWWNRLAFVCEPTGHIVGAFVLNRNGADYKSTSPFNLVASDDEWSAPIMAEVGPDGNMWVLDWYNYIVQHNPTPQGFTTGKGNAYESELRDKKHGRIYRLNYEGNDSKSPLAQTSEKAVGGQVSSLSPSAIAADAVVARGLTTATNDDLVDVLSHPTMRWRLIAQRMLVERNAADAATVQRLVKLAASSSVDAIGLNVGAMHALWTLKAIQLNRGESSKQTDSVSTSSANHAVLAALKSPTPGVRRAALQSLPQTEASANEVIQAQLTTDSDLQVRLAALLFLADVPTDASNKIGLHLGQIGESLTFDSWLLDAWTSSAAVHSESSLPALLTIEKPWSAELASRIGIVASHAARSRPSEQQMAATIIAMSKAPVGNTIAILQGFERGWPQDHALRIDAAAADALVTVMERLPINGKSLVIQLANRLGATTIQNKSETIRRELLAVVVNEKVDTKQRLEAAKMLVVMQPADDAIVDSFLSIINPQQAPELVNGLLTALQTSRSGKVGSATLELIPSLTPEAKNTAIRLLLAKPDTTAELLKSIQDGKLEFNDLALDQQQALRDHPDKPIRELATKIMKQGGFLLNSDRAKLVESWSDICEQKGDAVQGKLLFSKHCSLCHQHTGEGKNIGPDLTGMSVHPSMSCSLTSSIRIEASRETSASIPS